MTIDEMRELNGLADDLSAKLSTLEKQLGRRPDIAELSALARNAGMIIGEAVDVVFDPESTGTGP